MTKWQCTSRIRDSDGKVGTPDRGQSHVGIDYQEMEIEVWGNQEMSGGASGERIDT